MGEDGDFKESFPFNTFWKMCIESIETDFTRQTLCTILDNIISMFGAECGYIILLDNSSNKFSFIEARYKEKKSKPPADNICTQIIHNSIEKGQSIILNSSDCSNCKTNRTCKLASSIYSILCSPIEKSNTNQYIIYLSRSENSQHFDEHDLKTIHFIANNILSRVLKSYNKGCPKDENNSQLEQGLRQNYDFNAIIGHNPGIVKLLDLIVKVKDLDVPVLIEGESGVGKELIARAIHYNSKRKREPLISVNCGAIPENLLESEFFGYEKGAFTSATSKKDGQIKVAGAGTIFLDEIDDLNFNLQVKLLRVLQWGEYLPVGSSRHEKTSARFIASSNHNLKDLVNKGTFRDDLFYRLNVLRFFVPPLRDRIDDIPALCFYFLEKHCKKMGKTKLGLSPTALNVLMNYDYPGNIRELENILQRAIIMCESNIIDLEHLPFEIQKSNKSRPEIHLVFSEKFKQEKEKIVKEFEKEYLMQKLKESNGIILRAARNSGMYEANFRQKMVKYGLLQPKDNFHSGSSKIT